MSQYVLVRIVRMDNIDIGLFDYDRAQEHPHWAKELYGFADHKPETAEYGVQSFVYRARAPFDLMVDDIDASHAALTTAGLQPSAIEAGDIHRSFTITEPGGHLITVNSTHVTGLPV